MSLPRVHSHGKAARTSGGFTLLEVMLAFIVFALSFATVLEIMGGSMRSVARAGDDTEVALFAQSIIDLVGTEIPLEESTFSGTGLDRYRWQLVIYPYDPEGEDVRTMELAELTGTLLFRIDLDIDWTAGRRERDLRFTTIRSVLANRK